MLFGLGGAGFSFSASLTTRLKDLRDFVRKFSDDGIIFWKSKEEYLQ